MKMMVIGVIFALIVSTVFAGGAGERISGEKLLVDAEWLADNIDKVTLVEYSRSYEDYQKGHIPGALFLDRTVFYAEKDDLPGLLPDVEDVGAELGARGIKNKGILVVYDSGNGLWASRGFWGFEILGHRNVRLLDGGLAAWEASGGELTGREEIREPTRFKVRYQPELITDSAEILERYEADDFVVLDSRSEGEYEGTDARAERGGHIPNAINIDWIENITEDGNFKQIATLASIYDQNIDKNARVAAHCQTGVRGAHSYFVLRVLGYKDVALYDGSWVEWGNRTDTPIVSSTDY